MVQLQHVTVAEEQAAPAALPGLPLEQDRCQRRHSGVTSLSAAPVRPVAVERAAVAVYLHVPDGGRGLVSVQRVLGAGGAEVPLAAVAGVQVKALAAAREWNGRKAVILIVAALFQLAALVALGIAVFDIVSG